MMTLFSALTFLSLMAANSVSGADMGAASSQMLNTNSRNTGLTSLEPVQRVRIPIQLQGWNSVGSTIKEAGRQARIPSKPLNHVLRARIEKSNDFYLGDWRIETTPVRWLKNTNQYQVRLEIYRRFGESGQVEESVGVLNLSGVLQKQEDGLFVMGGSSKRKFFDKEGQPVLEIQAGTPLAQESSPVASKPGTQKTLR
jgi:hypothetical protein